VNIGGRAYNIDADAYSILDRYLKDVASRLQDSDVDSMDDIEARIADIFNERVSSTMQVVNSEMVRRAIAIIGRPDTFGGQRRGFSHQQESSYPHEPRRLYRSQSDKVIGGVCGGVAEYFDLDPNVVRLVTVLFVFLAGLSIWVYIIMWIVLPRSPYYVK
jgi:phage shock protein PspC (stress-responsive transcriptional regulator)